jgi:hypothetical protein
MFGLLYGLFEQAFAKKEYYALILGLDNAGKTVRHPPPNPNEPLRRSACAGTCCFMNGFGQTLLERMKATYGEKEALPPDRIAPTVGLNSTFSSAFLPRQASPTSHTLCCSSPLSVRCDSWTCGYGEGAISAVGSGRTVRPSFDLAGTLHSSIATSFPVGWLIAGCRLFTPTIARDRNTTRRPAVFSSYSMRRTSSDSRRPAPPFVRFAAFTTSSSPCWRDSL